MPKRCRSIRVPDGNFAWTCSSLEILSKRCTPRVSCLLSFRSRHRDLHQFLSLRKCFRCYGRAKACAGSKCWWGTWCCWCLRRSLCVAGLKAGGGNQDGQWSANKKLTTSVHRYENVPSCLPEQVMWRNCSDGTDSTIV